MSQLNHAPLLRVDHLSKAFGGNQAVRDVSFGVQAGELLALIGPNGAGKSTTFNLVNGQLAPDSGRGSITIDWVRPNWSVGRS
jgi:ABC-type branched-subunit amino acid transport system ATPase component